MSTRLPSNDGQLDTLSLESLRAKAATLPTPPLAPAAAPADAPPPAEPPPASSPTPSSRSSPLPSPPCCSRSLRMMSSTRRALISRSVSRFSKLKARSRRARSMFAASLSVRDWVRQSCSSGVKVLCLCLGPSRTPPPPAPPPPTPPPLAPLPPTPLLISAWPLTRELSARRMRRLPHRCGVLLSANWPR